MIVHQEATVHLQRVLTLIRKLRAKPGVALDLSTSLHMLECVLEDIDLLLIMTVNPGFGGQSLVSSTLRKLAGAHRSFQERGLRVHIHVDGNVGFECAPRMVRGGANYLVGAPRVSSIPTSPSRRASEG